MFDPTLELDHLRDHGLWRHLRQITSVQHPYLEVQGRTVLNFSSNDYLGFAQHPALKTAAQAALEKFGTGSTASRLISGSLQPFHELEEKIAFLKKTQAALTFGSGYATALGTIPAIVGKGDTIILDKLAHACLIDAARLSGATLRIFPHNDLSKLEKLLTSTTGRRLIVTESVFSMDGDLCPLREIVALKNQHGALLFLDEAHAVGVLGNQGLGLAEAEDLQDQVDFQMGTLGKALGSAGGYLAASRAWIDLLINRARSFIYSTAPPPAQAAASLAAFDLLISPEGQALRAELRKHCQTFSSPTPIIPRIIGENHATLLHAEQLFQKGFLVGAVRYPTVPRGTARLRLTLTACHTSAHLQSLLEVMARSPLGEGDSQTP